MKNKKFDACFRCYYEGNHNTEHRQLIALKEIPKWIEAYKFTHPACKAITMKIWFSDIEVNIEN